MSDRLEELLKRLDEYDNAYYNGEPLVEDDAYDAFKDSVFRRLPPDHPRLDKVGHAVSSQWKKQSHKIPMGSQNKVSTEDTIRDWIRKTLAELGLKEAEWILQHKIDGFSLELCYSEGKLEGGITRGDGNVGENIFDNVCLFRQVPGVLPIQKDIVTRGEGVFTKKDYEIIQKLVEKEAGKKYKNPRNAASGISRRLDGRYSKYIRVISYDINARVEKEIDKIRTLKKLGFVTVETFICKTEEEILTIYRDIRDNQRKNLPYEIDGLVLKLNDINLQEKLGVKRNRPEGQIALKFDSDKIVTTVQDLLLQVGRTGKITPVVILEPVDLMGSTIKKASVHNFSYIVEMGIGKGAEIAVEKKGEIIPQVTEVIMEGNPFALPEFCPSCGGSLEHDGVNIWCHNDVCKERDINRIVYWIQTLDMKGFSEKFVERLWDLGKIRSISDLYSLTADDFIAVEGIGEKTVKAFFKTMKETSSLHLTKFITALGIPTCSKSTAEILVERYGTWEKIASIKPSDLEKISGFAEISAGNVCDGIAEVRDMAEDLLKVIKILEVKKGVLTGMSFCVTGSLTSMGRKEFQKVVVDNGGIAKDSVSEGLTYLVTNSKDSGSAKNKKAAKLGVQIINEDEFLNLIGGYEKKEEKKKEKKEDLTIVSESLF